MIAAQGLAGRKVLLVEDDYFLADKMARTLEQGGAAVIGPAASVRRALELVEQSAPLDGAVLDIDLRGEKVYPVAAVLSERGVPFVFATNYSEAVIPPRYSSVTRYGKSLDPHSVARTLFT